MKQVVKIGTEDGPSSLPGRPVRIRPDTKGRYWVLPLDYAVPMVFGADGKFIRELRKGNGPNEFDHASFSSAIPGDSILLSAMTRGGFVVLGPDLSEKRTVRTTAPLMYARVISWPKQVLGETYERSSDGSYSRTTGVFDMSTSQAQLVHSVLTIPGTPRTATRAEQSRLYAESGRVSATPRDGHIWIAQVNRYKLIQYSLDGRAIDSIIREPSWFKGLVTPKMGSETTLPSPSLTAVEEDSQGRLWVFLAQPLPTATKAWKDAHMKWEKTPGGAQEGRVADMPAPYTQHRTIIEVIDPKTRRVVARRTVDGFVNDVINANRVVTFVENADGIPLATIWDLSLSAPSS